MLLGEAKGGEAGALCWGLVLTVSRVHLAGVPLLPLLGCPMLYLYKKGARALRGGIRSVLPKFHMGFRVQPSNRRQGILLFDLALNSFKISV